MAYISKHLSLSPCLSLSLSLSLPPSPPVLLVSTEPGSLGPLTVHFSLTTLSTPRSVQNKSFPPCWSRSSDDEAARSLGLAPPAVPNTGHRSSLQLSLAGLLARLPINTNRFPFRHLRYALMPDLTASPSQILYFHGHKKTGRGSFGCPGYVFVPEFMGCWPQKHTSAASTCFKTCPEFGFMLVVWGLYARKRNQKECLCPLLHNTFE